MMTKPMDTQAPVLDNANEDDPVMSECLTYQDILNA